MQAKYSQTTGLVRVYELGKNYEARDEFVSVVTVIWVTETQVRLVGAINQNHKDITKRLRAVFIELAHQGAMTVQLLRAKGKKMPGATLIKTLEKEDLWEIDLLEIVKLSKKTGNTEEALCKFNN